MSRIVIKVIPKSGRSELKIVGNSLKSWLVSAPEDGKANDELIVMLAEKLHIRRSLIRIASGFSSRNKHVDILGVTMADIEKILS